LFAFVVSFVTPRFGIGGEAKGPAALIHIFHNMGLILSDAFSCTLEVG
jgi:hypothetical protein